MDAFRRKAPVCLVALILCVPGLAGADQPTGVVVTYGDLDLSTHHGVTTIYARLEAAAKTVCTGREWPRDRISSCVDYSVRQAVARIGSPRLVVLYETRSGHAARGTTR